MTVLYCQNKLPSVATLQSAVQSATTTSARAQALLRLSDAYIAEKKYTEANTAASDALDLAKNAGLDSEAAAAYDNLGLVCRARFDYGNAMKHFIDAAKIRDNQKDKAGIALSNHLIGEVFFLQGDLENAQKSLLLAFEGRKNDKDTKLLAETNRALGDVYLKRKVFGKALEHYKAAIEQKVASEDLEGAAEIAGLLGSHAASLGDSEGALVYFRQAFDLHSGTENMKGMGQDYLNIGAALVQQQAFDESFTSFETARDIFVELKDTLGIATSMTNMAELHLKKGDKSGAENDLIGAIAILQKAKNAPGFPELYAEMANVYRDLGNFPKAYNCITLSNSAKEEVFGFEKNKALLELTTRFQSELAAEEQKRTISQLNIQQTAAQKVRWALLAVLALAGLALWALWNRNRIKKQDNLLLKAKNDEIDQKRKELADKNHRLDELNQKLVGEIAERELMEKNAFAKDKFLAVMSREMRTPMSKLLSLSRDLLENNPKPEQVEPLHNLQFNANNILVFINDMLHFSKIETGKIVLESVEFEPKKIITEVENRFSKLFSGKNTAFLLQYDEKIPPRLVGDPAHFSQIMSNLIANSAHSDDSKEVQVRVELAESTPNNCTLQVAVKDRGQCLTQMQMDAIYNMSLADLEDDQSAHTLGLAIAKRLTDLHNGRFEANSEEGQGATLMVTLPYELGNGKVRQTFFNTETIHEKLQGKKVLVVEDNRINQLVVCKMLQKAGISVTTADDGLAALEAFNKETFDMVLMDIQMPKLDGYRATAEMRKNTDVKKQTTPIIALTASAYLTDKDKAALFQMDDHIGKPFSPEELMEKVVICLVGG